MGCCFGSRLPCPVTIQNDTVWKDVDGVEIRAQGGSILKVNDTWYWYGFDGRTNGSRKGHVYSSKDLGHWKYERELFAEDGPSRLDVVYNAKTKKYVLIARIKIYNQYPLPEDKGVLLQVSDTPTGPFVPQPNMKLGSTAKRYYSQKNKNIPFRAIYVILCAPFPFNLLLPSSP